MVFAQEKDFPAKYHFFIAAHDVAACVRRRRSSRVASQGGQDGSHKKFCGAQESASGKLGDQCGAGWVDIKE